MYEIGKVYIWQNLDGPDIYLNGTETLVMGPMRRCRDQFDNFVMAQLTSTPHVSGRKMGAQRGMLRPKHIPPGEQLISDITARMPTEAEMQAFRVDEALEAWRANHSDIINFWQPKRQHPDAP